ncbi:MAG: FG-GAP-like repeat-containing protein [Planctomycetota bacterium]|jgi:tetratricopeptide (TPR) repeat protein
MRKKQRLLLAYGALALLTLALCAAGAVWLLGGEEEVPTEGLVPGVTNVLARQIPADAPQFRFTAVPLPWRHFPGVRTHRLPEDMGSGVAMEDLDGDGRKDLFFVNSAPLGAKPPPCALFANRGDFRFERVATELPELFGMGVASADYDSDGDFDLYVTGYGGNVLLRNDGEFRFTDVTAEAGVAGAGFSSGACWGDVDADGDLDLYVCRYVVFDENAPAVESQRGSLSLPATLNPSGFPSESNLLYLSEGGRFREAAEERGIANAGGKSLGALFVDFDRDGKLDLYVANDVTDNVMYRGLGGGKFEDISHASGTADWRGAMGLATGDPDRDGDLDLFVTHWKPEENALYVREEGVLFREDSLRTYLGPPGRGRIGWATDFVDLDLDGRPDLYVVNGSTFERPEARTQLVPMYPQLFWNGGARFWDLAPRAGPALQRPIVGRGGTAGDLDGDGDIDLVFVVHGGEPLLLRNDTVTDGGHLVVVVRGSAPNLFGCGAEVSVEAGGQRQVQAVGAKVSYLSSGPHDAHFGLGAAGFADRVAVRFPSGRVVERRRVRAGTRVVLKEVDARTFGPRMDEARDRITAGDLDAAREALRDVVRLDPAHPSALYLLAQLVPPRERLELCRRLIALEPMAPRGLLLRAKFLSDPLLPSLLDLDRALRDIAEARRLNRDETGGALEEGRILFLKGDIEQAAAILERVSRNPRAAALAALCHFRLGDAERATKLLGTRERAAPDNVSEEGDTASRKMGDLDPLARLLLMGRSPRWERIRLPVGPLEGAWCAFTDVNGNGTLDAQLGSRTVLLRGRRVDRVEDATPPEVQAPPRLRPYSFAEAAAFALDPPARCDGPPPGATATCEADADGDGDLDLFVACGGDPAAPLPWWVLLREKDGYRPVRGSIPEPG